LFDDRHENLSSASVLFLSSFQFSARPIRYTSLGKYAMLPGQIILYHVLLFEMPADKVSSILARLRHARTSQTLGESSSVQKGTHFNVGHRVETAVWVAVNFHSRMLAKPIPTSLAARLYDAETSAKAVGQ